MAKTGKKRNEGCGTIIALFFMAAIFKFFWDINHALAIAVATAPVILFILACSLRKPHRSHYGSAQAELSKIDVMSGQAFEQYCAQLFRDSGYFEGDEIKLTKASGDFGVDILIECKDHSRCVIQCKRYGKNLGLKSVQEVYAGKEYYGAAKAIVITNSYFTQSAIDLANSTDVMLFNRNDLAALITLCNNRYADTVKASKKKERKVKKGKRIYCTCEEPDAQYIDDDKNGWKNICRNFGKEVQG